MKTLARMCSVLGVVALLAMAGCGGDDDTTADAATGTPDSAGGGADGAGNAPTVAVTAAPTMVAVGADTMLTITVTNFTLEAPAGQPNAAGHGHYHVYADNASGVDYLTADSVTPVTITIPAGTPTGPHSLKVELFENDHSELVPPVSATVDIMVQ